MIKQMLGRIAAAGLILAIGLGFGPGDRAVAAQDQGLTVVLRCDRSPQTVRITNNTGADVTVERLNSSSGVERATEPFFPNYTIRDGDFVIFAFGVNPGAQAGNIFLSNTPIFTGDTDGIWLMTSAGEGSVTCAEGTGTIGAPAPTENDWFTIQISCLQAPQSVRITNVHTEPITVQTIAGILAVEHDHEPFTVDDELAPHDFVIYAFGPNPGAHAGETFLSPVPLFASLEPNRALDGVTVTTSVGSASVGCDAPAN